MRNIHLPPHMTTLACCFSIAKQHHHSQLLVVQGNGASPMRGVDGEEASSSALIHDLAILLQCDPAPSQALPVLEAISAAVDQLLPRLPPAFLEPILPPDSLDNYQVVRWQDFKSSDLSSL